MIGPGRDTRGNCEASPVLRHIPVELPEAGWVIRSGALAVSRGFAAVVMFAGALGVMAVWLRTSGAGTDGWMPFGWMFAWMAGVLSAVVLHELAHAGAAVLLGYRVLWLRLDFQGGAVEFAPTGGGVRPAHLTAITAAGPGANLVSALAAYATAALAAAGLASVAWAVLGTSQALATLSALVPYRRGSEPSWSPDLWERGRGSDGYVLWRLLRHRRMRAGT